MLSGFIQSHFSENIHPEEADLQRLIKPADMKLTVYLVFLVVIIAEIAAFGLYGMHSFFILFTAI